jgi:hypothetical protein
MHYSLEDVVLRILGGAEPLPVDQVGFSAQDLMTLHSILRKLTLRCGIQ